MASPNTRITSNIDHIIQGAGTFKVDGVEIGGFEGGVRVRWSSTDVFVDSENVGVRIHAEKTLTTMQVETEMEEASIENLAIAWGLHSSSVLSSPSSKVLSLNPPDAMEEVGLVFEGMSADNNTKVRTFTVHRAVRVGTSESTLRRGIKTTIPVTFECLYSNTNSEYGDITESII